MKSKSILQHLFHPQRSNNHRPRILHPLPLLYLSAIAIGVAGLLQAGSIFTGSLDRVLGYASSITPQDVVRQTNQERESKSLPVLTYSQPLSQAALAKAQDMFNDQYWSHVAPDGKQPWDFLDEAEYVYRVAGENLARDFMTTDGMVAAWMKSPTHRDNILHPRYTEIGIAVVDGTLAGHETTLVVQMFGTPTTEKPISQVTVEGAQKTGSNTNTTEPTVLSSVSVPGGSINTPPLFTPLQIGKAVFLSIIVILTLTLTYDMIIITNRKTARAVGKNAAHIIFLTVVAYLVIFFKAGVIG